MSTSEPRPLRMNQPVVRQIGAYLARLTDGHIVVENILSGGRAPKYKVSDVEWWFDTRQSSSNAASYLSGAVQSHLDRLGGNHEPDEEVMRAIERAREIDSGYLYDLGAEHGAKVFRETRCVHHGGRDHRSVDQVMAGLPIEQAMPSGGVCAGHAYEMRLKGRRHCFWVDLQAPVHGGRWVLSMVTENDPTHQRLDGVTKDATQYVYAPTLGAAREECVALNVPLHVSKWAMHEIVQSTEEALTAARSRNLRELKSR